MPDAVAPAGAEITELLDAWSDGHPEALDRLVPIVYGRLRMLAEQRMRFERPGHTLQPTALVHEAVLRLVRQKTIRWKDRHHFYAVAAKAMRHILVDHARSRRYKKRSGHRVDLDPDLLGRSPRLDLVALDESLRALGEVDPFKASVVELRYFAGFSLEEAADVLGCSRATVARHWSMAKAWLYDDLRGTRDA